MRLLGQMCRPLRLLVGVYLHISIPYVKLKKGPNIVEFKLRLPARQNVVWIPKEIVDTLGRKLKIAPDSIAAVLYPDGAELQDVLKSLSIIIQVLELRVSREARKK
jgi:hypothetical protein